MRVTMLSCVLIAATSVSAGFRLRAEERSTRLGTTTINVWSFGKGLPANKSSAGIQYVVGSVEAIDAPAKERAVQIDRPLGPFGTSLRTVWMSDPDGVTNYFAQVAGRTAPPQ